MNPSGTDSLRVREKIGWQAKALAPRGCKPLHVNVGQTLSSANPAIHPDFFTDSQGVDMDLRPTKADEDAP
jgi:hypothetical protein